MSRCSSWGHVSPPGSADDQRLSLRKGHTTLQYDASRAEDLHDTLHDGLEERMEGCVGRSPPHWDIDRVEAPSLLAHIHKIASSRKEILAKLMKADSHDPAQAIYLYQPRLLLVSAGAIACMLRLSTELHNEELSELTFQPSQCGASSKNCTGYPIALAWELAESSRHPLQTTHGRNLICQMGLPAIPKPHPRSTYGFILTESLHAYKRIRTCP